MSLESSLGADLLLLELNLLLSRMKCRSALKFRRANLGDVHLVGTLQVIVSGGNGGEGGGDEGGRD